MKTLLGTLMAAGLVLAFASPSPAQVLLQPGLGAPLGPPAIGAYQRATFGRYGGPWAYPPGYASYNTTTIVYSSGYAAPIGGYGQLPPLYAIPYGPNSAYGPGYIWPYTGMIVNGRYLRVR